MAETLEQLRARLEAGVFTEAEREAEARYMPGLRSAQKAGTLSFKVLAAKKVREDFNTEVKDHLGKFMNEPLDDVRERLHGILGNPGSGLPWRERPDAVAFQKLLGLSETDVDRMTSDAIARVRDEDARRTAETQRNRVPLNRLHPGVTAFAYVRRPDMTLGDHKFSRGDRVDLAEMHWPQGRLMTMVEQGWVTPDPAHAAAFEEACLVNGGAWVAVAGPLPHEPEPMDPGFLIDDAGGIQTVRMSAPVKPVTEPVETPEQRKKRLNREKVARHREQRRAREKEQRAAESTDQVEGAA